MRRQLVAILMPALLLAGALAAPAHADIAWTRCPDAGFEAYECGRLGVPLDRAGATPGDVDLFARRLRAPSPSRTAVVALAGGPGQAAAPLASSFAIALATGLQDRDLIVFDQRGTGQSSPLRCESLERRGSGVELARACADELGPRRAHFRTVDTVADLEDIRREGGYDRLAIFGVSYGTKVALAYAERHPDRVERLILDSVVPPEGPDPLQRSSFAAVRRILREQCAGGRCRGVTPDAARDVRSLVRRTRRLRGSYIDPRGRRRTAEVSGGAIYPILRITDLNPALRGQVSGAVRAAVRGDETPLLRVASLALGGPGDSRALQTVQEAQGNTALLLATVCEEIAFPWDRAAGTQARSQQATRALLATPASAFAPFDRATAASSGLLSLCLGWPNATPPPAPPGALPPIPTLVLSGAADIRTPVEDARAIAARIPSAPAVVVVPNVGHSVVGSDPTGCARAAVSSFFREGTAAPCPASRPLVRPLPRPPRRLGELRPVARVPGRTGRTLAAVIRTRDDALVSGLGAQLDGRRSVGGLRGGVIAVRGDDVVLRRVQYVRGVRVSGTFAANRTTARLRVTGSGARGAVTFHRSDGRITGRLGGRRIRVRPAARAASRGTRPAADWTGFAGLRALAPLRR